MKRNSEKTLKKHLNPYGLFATTKPANLANNTKHTSSRNERRLLAKKYAMDTNPTSSQGIWNDVMNIRQSTADAVRIVTSVSSEILKLNLVKNYIATNSDAGMLAAEIKKETLSLYDKFLETTKKHMLNPLELDDILSEKSNSVIMFPQTRKPDIEEYGKAMDIYSSYGLILTTVGLISKNSLAQLIVLLKESIPSPTPDNAADVAEAYDTLNRIDKLI